MMYAVCGLVRHKAGWPVKCCACSLLPAKRLSFQYTHFTVFFLLHGVPPGTRFGAMLDMLTDRCATMCLLVNLAMLYPESALWFQLSMSLDVASHWLHLHRYFLREGTIFTQWGRVCLLSNSFCVQGFCGLNQMFPNSLAMSSISIVCPLLMQGLYIIIIWCRRSGTAPVQVAGWRLLP